MTIEEVRECIREIVSLNASRDTEDLHYARDNLYLEVLESIAKDPSNAQELAKEALKAVDLITMTLWYS